MAEEKHRLEIRGLKTFFFTEAGVARAVDGIHLRVDPGETLGLAGESGCGKSVTCLSILRLVPTPGKIVAGEILYKGNNLLSLPEKAMRRIRWNSISMVFQEPTTSLNPVFTVGSQIGEAIRLHRGASRKKARDRTVELLRRVKMPSPEIRVDSYPHQLSGGMQQRAMMAMALACDPAVLIADEPSTALDVTIEAQIMDLLKELQKDLGMSVLIVTHNLAILAQIADSIAMMYASKIIEYTTTQQLFSTPLHPYTKGLLDCIPCLGAARDRKLHVIPGQVPDPLHYPQGCKFHPRCTAAVEICRTEEPELREVYAGHWAACHLAESLPAASETTAEAITAASPWREEEDSDARE